MVTIEPSHCSGCWRVDNGRCATGTRPSTVTAATGVNWSPGGELVDLPASKGIDLLAV